MEPIQDSQPNEEKPKPIQLSMSSRHCLIAIGTAVGTVIEGILPHSFGTLIANYKSPSNSTPNSDFYLASQFQLNWIPALSSAFPCILLPLFAIIVQKYYRFYQLHSAIGFAITALSCACSSLATLWEIQLFTHGVLYSVGTSLFLAVVIVITAEYFPVEHKFHVLATSLYQIGYPVAALVGNPVLAILIINYGWQQSLRIIALTQLLCGPFIAFIMVPINYKGFCKHDTDDSDKTLLLQDMPPNLNRSYSSKLMLHHVVPKQMWSWLFAKYFNYMCWYGLRTNIVTYLVKSTNFGLSNSASLMSIYAAAEISIAITASLLGDRLRGWLVHIHVIAAALLAVLTGIYPSVLSTYLSAVILMICIGIAIQLSLSFGYPASVEVWNSEMDMKTGWVLTNVAAGLGITCSPLVSGIFMDHFGINSMFYAQACGWIIQIILYTITLIIMKFSKTT